VVNGHSFLVDIDRPVGDVIEWPRLSQ